LAFINYIYQFEQKVKLYLNCHIEFAPFFGLLQISNPGKIISKSSKKLKKYTAFRGQSVHNWHTAPAIIGQLPLVETMQENEDFYRQLPGTGYLDLPPKHLFRLTRRNMRFEMENAMQMMAEISQSITSEHRSSIYTACFKLSSYTQWAKAGQAKFKFG